MNGTVEANALEYREVQEELHQKQTDLAITGTKLELESQGIVEDIVRLEETVSASDPESSLLRQIQMVRSRAEEHQANAEELNRQLAEERETSSILSEKFNRYESEADKIRAELATVKIENKKLAGQRNTLLVILITTGIAILVFVIFKARKFF
jgi:chromosome segregation ATPase